ncbi:MAG: carbohydrate ABC transporter permease, partial [Eubacterium sp.]|nr:carbohydrate ABC transporter permease [Eubacterium sp.]
MEQVVTNKKIIYKNSDIDIDAVREEMYRKQRAVKMRRTGIRLLANVFLTLVVLLPLLYAISVAFMPS